ncbi:hypothetical protein Tco_0218263 [Tanacetum coccineum]
MLLAMKDKAGSNLSNEENDFMLDNSYRDETMEELTAIVMLMSRIQPADGNAEIVPSYDAKAVSEVNASSKVHEQVSHVKRKTIIQTYDDDQIDSNIIFDDPYVKNNDGMSNHESNDHDEYHKIQMLAYNVQREAEIQKRFNNELKKQKLLLQQELETRKDGVKIFDSKTIQCSKYKETCEELERELRTNKDTIERILKEKDKIQNDFFKVEIEKLIIQHETQLTKKVFKEREDRYLDDIVDLKEKPSSHDWIVYKMGQSIQTIHMLGKEPNRVYDPFLKAWLGYKNPKRLKKTIAAQPKMYDDERLHSVNLTINSPDYEETLKDAEKKNELLKADLEKSSSDSKDIQANLLKRIKILENDLERSQTQSTDFELKLRHQKEKMACDISWKSKLSTINDENNQDLLITIYELKNKLKTVDEGKNVNTKFDKSETSGTLLCVTPLPKNIAVKAKIVSNSKVNADRSKPVTSHSTPKNEQSRKLNKNVLAKGSVESSNSVTDDIEQLIMEYLVNISKRRAFWSLNEDILKITILTTNTPYPSRKIRRICACTHQRPRRTQDQYTLRITKVIKGEFEKLEDLKVKDVLLTCDTSLEVFSNEFNRLSGMDNDLFTYEVEIANIPCDSNKDDDSGQRMLHEADDNMGYDPSDIRGDDEVELTDEEFSNNEDEVVEVFRIDTNIFDFETPMCKTFNEFNYLLQIDPDLLTKDIEGFKTYDEYKDD